MPGNMTQHRDNVPAARELRERQTPAEEVLWEALRGRRLAGLKFRRQHPIGPFVVDFCCPDRRLAIELDGTVHATQGEHDAEREALLVAAGYRVLRFPNEAIRDNFPAVLEAILHAAAGQPSLPAVRIPRTGALYRPQQPLSLRTG
jgi:very-short-patch-repair endonuclease